MRDRWVTSALTLALACLPLGPAAAQTKPIELKFSSWVSTVHGHHTGVMVPWAKMIEEKSMLATLVLPSAAVISAVFSSFKPLST